MSNEFMTLGAYFELDELSESLQEQIKDLNRGLTVTPENTLVYVRKENFSHGIGYDITSEVFTAAGEPPESAGFCTSKITGEEQQQLDSLLFAKVRYNLEHINDQ